MLLTMPGFPMRGGGGGGRRGGGRGGGGRGGGGGGRGGGGRGVKRKRKPNWLQVAEAEQMNIKRLKEAEEKRKDEEELEEGEDEGEEETAFDSLLGFIGESRTEDPEDDGDDDNDDEENDDASSKEDSDDDGEMSDKVTKHSMEDSQTGSTKNGDTEDVDDESDDDDNDNSSPTKDTFSVCFQRDLAEGEGDSFKNAPSYVKSPVRCDKLGYGTSHLNPAFSDLLKVKICVLKSTVSKRKSHIL